MRQHKHPLNDLMYPERFFFILIAEDDRKYQLIVWRNDTKEVLHCFQLNTLTYETRSAPYLATKCQQQLSTENAVKHPLAAKILLEDFNIDDGLTGSDNLQATIGSQLQLTKIIVDGGFRLIDPSTKSGSKFEF